MESTLPARRTRISSPADVLPLIRHHIGVGAMTTLAVGFVALWIFLLLPRNFDSQAHLLVRVGRESVTPDATVALGPSIGTTQTRRSELNSEAQMLTSLDVLRRVAEDRSNSRDGIDAYVERLERKLWVHAHDQSNVITVGYRSGDPKDATETLSRVLERYLELHAKSYGNPDSEKFFLKSLGETEDRLLAARTELRKELGKLGAHSLAQHRTSLLERKASVQREHAGAVAALEVACARMRQMEFSIRGLEKMTVLEETDNPSTTRTEIERHLTSLELRLQSMLTNYSPETDVVKNLKEQIRLAKATLSAKGKDRVTVRRGINANRQRLELDHRLEKANRAGLHSKCQHLDEQQREVLAQLARLDAREGDLTRLEAKITALESARTRYLAGLEQARTDIAMASSKMTNISVIQAPSEPSGPAGPPRIWILIVGGFLALSSGLAAVFLTDFFDATIQVPQDVPVFLDRNVIASFRLDDAMKIPVSRAFDSKMAVQLTRGARTEMAFLVGEAISSAKQQSILSLTSPLEKSGNSSFAFHFAARLASAGVGKVLLVDASDSPSNLTRSLELQATASAQDIGIAGLKILPRWRQDCDLAKTLEVTKSEAADARFVIFDLPALSSNGTALEFTRRSHHTILTLAAGADVDATRRSLRLLDRSNADLLGVVLNKQELELGTEA